MRKHLVDTHGIGYLNVDQRLDISNYGGWKPFSGYKAEMARCIHVIGIGAGNPDYLTVQAIEALNSADVFLSRTRARRNATWWRCARRSARGSFVSPGTALSSCPIPSGRSQCLVKPAIGKR